MRNKMLVESDPHQVRIAILEADRLTEVFVEWPGDRGAVGNIYKGRVSRVLPGMQAAFVDIGLERDAFLYVSDIVELEPDDDADHAGGTAHAPPAIDQLLEPHEELLVQVTKDAIGTKGARVTAHVTLPSRYLVLLPAMRHLGVSRRIESVDERDRLRECLEQLGSSQHGLIVRTAGEGKHEQEFANDHRYLLETWEHIGEAARMAQAPALLHTDLDLALRVVRDRFNEDFDVLWVDREDTFERIVEFLDRVQPSLTSKVKLHTRHSDLFEAFEIDREIESALASRVWLKSGGYIVINQTEALVAIDVNTGRYVGKKDLESTVLQTNLEAVREIVRQIRLRDLSGILVIDLIDMTSSDHRDQVTALFEEELKKDHARSKMLQISEFGLIEITRKRSHANLERLLTRPCPYCRGGGRIKTLRTICLDIRSEVLSWTRRGDEVGDLVLRVHPEVAQALQGPERAILDELHATMGSSLLLRQDGDLHQERFDLSLV